MAVKVCGQRIAKMEKKKCWLLKCNVLYKFNLFIGFIHESIYLFVPIICVHCDIVSAILCYRQILGRFSVVARDN